LYIQGGSVDILKENFIENLKNRSLSYTIVRKYLSDLKEEFGERDNKTMKVVKLKKVE